MMTQSPALIPELDVTDLQRSLRFYVDLLGFSVGVERPEERFAYLVRGEVHLMLEEAAGPGRRFRTAELKHPFGRGVNLQIRVDDVDVLYASVLVAPWPMIIELEERWYRQSRIERGNRQFVIADPDGYLLRFFGDLGSRAAMT